MESPTNLPLFESICSGEEFGPFIDGMISYCFLDSILFPLLFTVYLGLGLYRIISLMRSPDVVVRATKIYFFQLGSCVVLCLVPVMHLLYRIVVLGDVVRTFEVVADVVETATFALCFVVCIVQNNKGETNNWINKFFWVSSFVLEMFRLQILLKDMRIHAPEFLMSLSSISIYVLLQFQALLCTTIPKDHLYDEIEQIIEEEEVQELPHDILNDIPVDEEKGAEELASILSKISYSYINPLLKLGYTRALDIKDLGPLSTQDRVQGNTEKFMRNWERIKIERGKTSVWRTLIATFGFAFAFAGIFKLVQDILVFAGPFFLQRIIAFMSSDEELHWGILYSLGLLVSSLIQSISLHIYFHRVFRVGMNVYSTLVSAIYRKSFKLSFGARQEYTVGEIVNHQSLDSQRLLGLFPYLHMIWSAPVQLTISIIMLWNILGPSILAGLACLLLITPTNMWMGKILGRYQKEMMSHKDKRTKILSEVFQGIRVIKFFAWESSFIEKITGIRNDEMETLKKSAFVRAFFVFFWGCTTLIISSITFIVFIAVGNELNAEIAFTSIALFNIMRFPISMLPNVLTNLIETFVSVRRLQKFFDSEELDEEAVQRSTNEFSENAVTIKNGSFSWSETTNTLTDIDIEVPKGSLVAVVGSVGSGKSSLLSACLGEIPKSSGSVTVNGSLSYVPQQAWMQNSSLRDNITFGKPYDHKLYEHTVDCCELHSDIDMLPGGDDTEIGEKGINLSGGQKQRISLARAVYQDSDIYLFDDPLSAVDAHVGKNIFFNCIQGNLEGKTRILVTHQLQFVKYCDYIVVLKNGSVNEQGTYSELMDHKGEFSNLITTHVGHNESSESSEEEEEMEKKEKKGKTDDKLIKEEQRDTGEVKWSVYLAYFKALGGFLFVAIVIFLYVADSASDVGNNYFLALWSERSSAAVKNNQEFDSAPYLWIYVGLGLLVAVFTVLKQIVLALSGIRASKKTHIDMLQSTMRSPTSFFDTTPVGRILNRFTKDQYTVDAVIPGTIGSSLRTMFACITVIFVIATVTPFFLVVLFPLSFVYRFIQQYYLRSSRELSRLDSISKSPIYSLFGETISGLSTIRAYEKSNTFIRLNESKIDTNQKAYFLKFTANRWLGLRLEFIGTIVVFGAAFFSVIEKGTLDAALVGLSLTYALQLTGQLNWLVRMSTEVESNLVAVERVSEYSSLDPENLYGSESVPENWPSKGAIKFEGYSLRYRPKLPLVLKDVNFEVLPKEKIGVVGRTGAGKSSLMSALFRMIEPASGTIYIDDVDITDIDLLDLRSRIAIIPQDPTLFTGTIRSNLDPFDQYAEHQLWDCIESVGLTEQISNMEGQLDSPVTEYGENLSVGTRQLMCLARALLRHPKVLILDEATASVDFETDSLIQQTIREKFVNTTVLTIAHRINTILDSDRILVMEQGEVAEFDTPDNLLKDKNGFFTNLVNQSNTGVIDNTTKMAE
eukprot:TRINITY_DN4019_c0_g1_i1.p1 TRINITY_DN4019_c0_g1~~TRINITY_DN4019_c0_g1_i1.p1  ORF type:complete len:1462 (+),score=305.81 TRINITY_DN4019_c0_g1_i1:37-4422(+)